MVDLVGRKQNAKIKTRLDDHFHRYRLIEAQHGNVPLEILLACSRFDAAKLAARGGRESFLEVGEHSLGNKEDAWPPTSTKDSRPRSPDAHAFRTWSYETDQPLALEALRKVASRLPVDIYRCKGVIQSVEAPERRAILQVVGKRVDISIENEWGDRPPRTQIVAIGAHGSVDSEALRERFDHCRVEARGCR